MFYSFIFWLAQIENEAGGAVEKVADEAASKPGGGLMFFLPMMLALLVMMLLMRPKKTDQKTKERLTALKKNDRVVTAGGIIGTIVAVRDDTNSVTLRIDESSNTKMQMLKSSIVKVITDEKPGD